MKVWFTVPPNYLDEIKKDFSEVKKLGLPCEIDGFFEVIEKPRQPDDIAIAFYSKPDLERGYPNIESNKDYFSRSLYERQLILLHEIIHACQRVNDLNTLNKKYLVDGVQELNDMVDSYIKENGKDPGLNYLKSQLQNIGLFSTWIFEIWNEMLLKKKYPKYFEDKMKVTYDTISCQYTKNAYSSAGEWTKFPVFIHMVRAYYLMKMSKGLEVSSKYQDLFSRWEKELLECTEQEEYLKFMKWLGPLTDIRSYDKSDTSILEKPYDRFIDIMKKSLFH